MLNIKSFYFNPFGTCCIVAWDESGKAVIVDPGAYTDEELVCLEDFIATKSLQTEYVLLTHAHFDHIFGVSAVAAAYGVPVVMDAKDRVIIENNKLFCMNFGLRVPDNSFAEGEWKPYAGSQGQPDATAQKQNSEQQNYKPEVLTIVDGDIVCWGAGRRWEVLSTPGHTPGGVSFLDREAKLLVGGDTLFAGAIGRTDNKWGDYDVLIRAIFEKLMVLDGDITVIPGHGGPTTIADERAKNPFLQPFNEEYPDPDDERD